MTSVFGKTFEDIAENLKQILLRFQEANLKINPKKCNLFGRQGDEIFRSCCNS